MIKILLLGLDYFIIIFSISNCSSGNPPNDEVWFAVGQITIYQSQTNNITVNFRRSSGYNYLHLNFEGNTSQLQTISGYPTGSDQTINIPLHIDPALNIPSGNNYRLFAHMTGSGKPKISAVKENVIYQSSYTPQPANVLLSFESDNPVNYYIDNDYLFSLDVKAKVLQGSDDYYGRVFLEVDFPGNYNTYDSDYFVFKFDDPVHTFTLDYGGGDYTWDGDMIIHAKCIVYDTWPGGNKIAEFSKIYQPNGDPNACKIFKPIPQPPALTNYDVEYDQMVNMNLYDTAINPYRLMIDYAYNPAVIKLTFLKDPNNQTITIQTIDFSTPQGQNDALAFITQHRNQNKDKYICAVPNIKDNLNRDVLGAELHDENTDEHLGIFVAYQYTQNFSVDNNFYAGATNDNLFPFMINSVVIHELGHALGIRGHGGHSFADDFCVMHEGQVVISNEHSVYRYVNPHFCQEHINFLKEHGQEIAGVIQ